MTGPQHYCEAEQVIAQVKNRDVPADAAAAYAAVAQVHATLALAAATAEAFTPLDHSVQIWREVIR